MYTVQCLVMKTHEEIGGNVWKIARRSLVLRAFGRIVDDTAKN